MTWDDAAGMVAAQGLPPPLSPVRLLTEWAFEPIPVALLVVAGLLYGAGLRRLARTGKGPRWPSSRTWAFFGGLAAAGLALLSPVDVYAEVSFSTHMVQHVLLMMVAAPLFALGAPVTLTLRASSPRTRRRILLPTLHSRATAVLTHPVVAFVLFAVVQYVTHFTGFYEAALESTGVHYLEHALYLVAAVLFWWSVVGLDPAPRKLSHPARLLYLVAAMPVEAFLSVALLSARPYAAYASLPAPWGGAAAAADQSNASAIMWIAGDLTMLVAALLTAGAWLRHEQIKQRRIEDEEDRRAGLALGDSPGRS
jgi:cytochrome c oxidase assembly factor CtaG